MNYFEILLSTDVVKKVGSASRKQLYQSIGDVPLFNNGLHKPKIKTSLKSLLQNLYEV